jgi:hypothetical protein
VLGSRVRVQGGEGGDCAGELMLKRCKRGLCGRCDVTNEVDIVGERRDLEK